MDRTWYGFEREIYVAVAGAPQERSWNYFPVFFLQLVLRSKLRLHFNFILILLLLLEATTFSC